jgi:cell division protein FtsI/penicillin-binding protein 2
VPAQNSGQITAMDLPGIYQTASYARSYPDGSVAANLIGFTGTKNGTITGGGGLELEYDKLLSG